MRPHPTITVLLQGTHPKNKRGDYEDKMCFANVRVTAISCLDRLQNVGSYKARFTASMEVIRNGQPPSYQHSNTLTFSLGYCVHSQWTRPCLPSGKIEDPVLSVVKHECFMNNHSANGLVARSKQICIPTNKCKRYVSYTQCSHDANGMATPVTNSVEIRATPEATSCAVIRVSQHPMEPEGSLQRSQQLSTCTYPEPDKSRPQQPILSLQDLRVS
jgi:hypothetical protein